MPPAGAPASVHLGLEVADESGDGASDELTHERALVARASAGDDAACRELVEQHHPAMRRFARAAVDSDDAASELVQETWLAAFESMARFEGRSRLRTWLFGILTNRLRKRLSRGGREQLCDFAAEVAREERAVDPDRFTAMGMWRKPPEPLVCRVSPEDAAARRQLREHLAAAIATLPQAQRMVLVLRDVEQCDAAEVSELLGVSQGNQRVLLHRARARLRTALEGQATKGGER
jgi:RNA polymerase sigma-70 factor (ECF subfamily)